MARNSTYLRGVLLALLAGLIMVAAAHALAPYRVKDICPGGSASWPENLIAVGDLVYFKADDCSRGVELWRSDGTADGTRIVRDIWPGPDGSLFDSQEPMIVVNGTLYFGANDGSKGVELWKSDGTEDGTVLVRDINPGPDGSWPETLTYSVDDDKVLFTADDGSHGRELWTSDGTEAGTELVLDINPIDDGPTIVVPVAQSFFCDADDGIHGRELWKSDGTADGTDLVKDINPVGDGINVIDFCPIEIGGKVFFDANDGSSGAELWKTDGTEAGTVRVKDINPGVNGSYPVNLTKVNDTLFFNAGDGTHGAELWKSDGTEGDTLLVKDIFSGALPSYPENLTAVDDTLFFTADDGSSGIELWKSDGTEEGTLLVKDIRSGGDSSYPEHLTAVDDLLYFTADDGIDGVELWKSDGTKAGTVLVEDISGPGGGTSLDWLTAVNGTLFFSADDTIKGGELWALREGGPVVDPEDLSVTTIKGKRNFRKEGRDTLLVNGELGLPKSFLPAGKSFRLDVGGVIVDFLLDRKGKGSLLAGAGKAASASGKLRLKFMRKKDRWGFRAKIKKSSFAEAWEDEGLIDADSKNAPVSLRTAITVDALSFYTVNALEYSCKAGRSGKVK